MEVREAEDVRELLRNSSPDTAGGMMNTEIVVVGEDATRGEVVDYIRFHEHLARSARQRGPDQQRRGRSAGTVPIARLLLADSEQRMAELAFEPLVSVTADATTKMFSSFSTNTICAA